MIVYWCFGVVGSFLLGMCYGVYCVGCCWVLMVLFFVGGVMNFVWIVVLLFVVFVEKILFCGEYVGCVLGVVLIVWVGVMLLV